MLKAIVLFAMLLIPAVGWGEDPPLVLEALPVHQFAPGYMRYRIRVQTHRDNVALCFGYNEPNKYRKSCIQLNGIYSPRVYWQEYHNLSPANYEAFVQLFRAPNRIAAQEIKEFIVIALDH